MPLTKDEQLLALSQETIGTFDITPSSEAASLTWRPCRSSHASTAAVNSAA
jgi:hypothetical protein